MRIDGGKLFMGWMQDAQQELGQAKDEGFGPASEALGKAIQAIAASAMHIAGVSQGGKMEAALVQAVPAFQHTAEVGKLSEGEFQNTLFPESWKMVAQSLLYEQSASSVTCTTASSARSRMKP